MRAAQAIVEDMAIVSNDEKLSALGARGGCGGPAHYLTEHNRLSIGLRGLLTLWR